MEKKEKKQSRRGYILELINRGMKENATIVEKVRERFPTSSAKKIRTAISVARYDLKNPRKYVAKAKKAKKAA